MKSSSGITVDLEKTTLFVIIRTMYGSLIHEDAEKPTLLVIPEVECMYITWFTIQ